MPYPPATWPPGSRHSARSNQAGFWSGLPLTALAKRPLHILGGCAASCCASKEKAGGWSASEPELLVWSMPGHRHQHWATESQYLWDEGDVRAHPAPHVDLLPGATMPNDSAPSCAHTSPPALRRSIRFPRLQLTGFSARSAHQIDVILVV